MARYVVRGRRRHAADLHARRGGRGPGPRAGAPGRRARRPARSAPRGRAGRGDGGARRHRPPLPRRRRTLARLGDDGAADQRPAGRRSGGPTCSRRPPRSCAVVREVRPQVLRHLRHQRRVRPPRPHPGAPGRDVRHGTGRCARLPARPRSGLGRAEGVLGVPSPGRCSRGASRSWPRPAGRALFGVENADELPFTVDDSVVTARGRRGRARAAEDGGAARAPHPGRPGRSVLRDGRGDRAGGVRARVLQPGQGHPGSAPGRATGWETDLFDGVD